jgi:hypothetical protein
MASVENVLVTWLESFPAETPPATCDVRDKDARASAAGAPIGWVIGAREPQTPATEARILRRERLRQPRQTPAEPHPTLFNARKPAKVHR